MNAFRNLRATTATCLLTLAVVPSLRAAGARQVVEVSGLDDERIAFTNFAETAEAVAFDKLPRPHLLRSWKDLGVTVLKTVRCEPDGTAEFVRRQVGFLAFQEGADGVWLPGEADLPENAREAVRRGRTDREILDYLASLRDRAAKSEDGLLRVRPGRLFVFVVRDERHVRRLPLPARFASGRLPAVSFPRRP